MLNHRLTEKNDPCNGRLSTLFILISKHSGVEFNARAYNTNVDSYYTQYLVDHWLHCIDFDKKNFIPYHLTRCQMDQLDWAIEFMTYKTWMMEESQP